MTMVWIGLGAVLAIIAIVVVVGLFLGERFEGRAQAAFDRPAEQVWDALLDYDRHPMTGKMKKSVEALPDEHGRPRWIEDMGHNERVTVTTVESQRPARLVREMESASASMTSRWEYALESTEGGCRLSMDGVTFIRSGSWIAPIFRFMMTVGGGVKKGLVIQMDMVAHSLGTEARHED